MAIRTPASKHLINLLLTYHDGERRCVHADGEDGGGEAAEDLAGVAMEGQQRDEHHGGEDGGDDAEEAQHAEPGPPVHREDEEDHHVDALDHRPRPVDRRHQDVVRGHERQAVPVYVCMYILHTYCMN